MAILRAVELMMGVFLLMLATVMFRWWLETDDPELRLRSFRYGYVDDDGVYRPRDFDFSDFEYDAEEVTMLFSEDALKALADKMLEEVTMNYAGIDQGIEVYRCSHCQADVYHTIYWYDFCPSCGRKIKEWK